MGSTVTSAVPCDMAMPSMAMDLGAMDQGAVDRGMTQPAEPDRAKHLCCVTAVALTADVVDAAPAAPAGIVTYWPATADATGLTQQPEFIPLRTS